MLDVRPRQVYIAAVIGELNLKDDMEFGFNYFLRNQSKDGSSVGGALINALPGTNVFTAPDLITPASLAAGAFTGMTLYGTIANSLDYYVRALETTGKFKIISRPVVYTTNNKKAVISSGQRVPYTSSTLTSTSITGVGPNQNAGVTANITYLDVLLKLEVLPLINANRDVTLVIVQTNNNVLREETFGSGNKAPVVGAQELTTTVTVPSGGTVVLGGLIIEKTKADDGGLPFLMRLPVLGYIFKQTTRAVERQELLILLQPTVVEDDAETATAYSIADNRIGQLGEWNVEELVLAFDKIDFADFDSIGFSEGDVEDYRALLDEQAINAPAMPEMNGHLGEKAGNVQESPDLTVKKDATYAEFLERYANRAVRAIILYYPHDQYGRMVENLDKLSKELGTKDNAETIELLVKEKLS
jgi:hypothetical protein